MSCLALPNSFLFNIPTLGHVCLALPLQIHLYSTFLPLGMYALPCLVKFICIRHSYPWACILPCLDKFIWILENSCFLAFSMHAEHIIELSALGHVCLACMYALLACMPCLHVCSFQILAISQPLACMPCFFHFKAFLALLLMPLAGFG